jgi:hypothetical protein
VEQPEPVQMMLRASSSIEAVSLLKSNPIHSNELTDVRPNANRPLLWQVAANRKREEETLLPTAIMTVTHSRRYITDKCGLLLPRNLYLINFK